MMLTTYSSTTSLLDCPEFSVTVALAPVAPPPAAPPAPAGSRVTVLGVEVTDVATGQAIRLLDQWMHERNGRARCAYFVNAHTLNLAAADPEYRAVLNAADCVFGDGTGVRWAARLRGVSLRDNVNGTDLVPALLRATASRAYHCFLLGADRPTIHRAAQYVAEHFPGWTVAGCHDGFLGDSGRTECAIRQINRARPDLLLVGMGNPLQERWLHDHRRHLRASVCMAVGGLFDFWAGNFSRAPVWLRRLGHEWLWRLAQQPGAKARRYLWGNPLFLMRAVRESLAAGRWDLASNF